MVLDADDAEKALVVGMLRRGTDNGGRGEKSWGRTLLEKLGA